MTPSLQGCKGDDLDLRQGVGRRRVTTSWCPQRKATAGNTFFFRSLLNAIHKNTRHKCATEQKCGGFFAYCRSEGNGGFPEAQGKEIKVGILAILGIVLIVLIVVVLI
jgi:hypothetical protein